MRCLRRDNGLLIGRRGQSVVFGKRIGSTFIGVGAGEFAAGFSGCATGVQHSLFGVCSSCGGFRGDFLLLCRSQEWFFRHVGVCFLQFSKNFLLLVFGDLLRGFEDRRLCGSGCTCGRGSGSFLLSPHIGNHLGFHTLQQLLHAAEVVVLWSGRALCAFGSAPLFDRSEVRVLCENPLLHFLDTLQDSGTGFTHAARWSAPLVGVQQFGLHQLLKFLIGGSGQVFGGLRKIGVRIESQHRRQLGFPLE